MNRVMGGTLLFLCVGLAALFGLVWAACLGLSALAIWIWRGANKLGAWMKPVALVILIALIGTMWLTGKAPSHVGLGSAAASRLPWGSAISPTPSLYTVARQTPQLDEVVQVKDAFRSDVIRLRSQANAVERALALKAASDRVVSYAESQEIPIKDVLDAKRAVDESLKSRGLDSVEALTRTKDALDTFLRDAERDVEHVDKAGAQRFLTNFRLKSVTKSIEDVNDHMLRLESAINKLQRDAVAKDITLKLNYGVQLDEPADHLIRSQIVTLLVNDVRVKTLDASELLLDKDPNAISEDVEVLFGDAKGNAPVKVLSPQLIPIRAGVKKITLFKRTVLPATLKDLPAPLRLVPFRYFLFKWPAPTSIKIRATLDLSAAKGPDEFPYAFEVPTDQLISQVRLPSDAYFASSYGFKAPRREGEEDVLEPADDQFKPSFFLTTNQIWIELMPNSHVFRNSAIQGRKEYLFPENLTAGLVVIAIGAILALIFP